MWELTPFNNIRARWWHHRQTDAHLMPSQPEQAFRARIQYFNADGIRCKAQLCETLCDGFFNSGSDDLQSGFLVHTRILILFFLSAR